MSEESAPPPGWYLNSAGQKQWWDGHAWGPGWPAAPSGGATPPSQAAVGTSVASSKSDEPSWGKSIAWLVAGAVVAFLVWGLPAITRVKPADMAAECIEVVASWAGVTPEEVEWVDVSDENFSETAWDFRGSYPGGTWACGGRSDERTPSQIVVYPLDGVAQVLE